MLKWVLFILMFLVRPAYAGDGLDVKDWLSRPGVKLLAVEFYASWCGPCKKAVPKWKALHEKYRDEGFRLVVVSVQDPDGACVNPGWNPDDVVCDTEGRLAEAWGVGDRLPAAFLWSWRGTLLVRKGHVAEVQRAAEDELGRLPRVTLDKGMNRRVRELLRTELARTGKVQVVAGTEEEEALAAIRRRSHEIQFSDRTACRLGERLAANSLLKARLVKAGNGKRLLLQLFSAETGCMNASAGVFWNTKKPELSVAEAAAELEEGLRGPVQFARLDASEERADDKQRQPEPRSEIAFGGGTQVKLPKIDVSENTDAGLSDVNIEAEEAYARALEMNDRSNKSPEEKSLVWCKLAGIKKGNPYASMAADACKRWKQYSAGLAKALRRISGDYDKLRRYLRLGTKSAELKKAAVVAFLDAYSAFAWHEMVIAAKAAADEFEAGREAELPVIMPMIRIPAGEFWSGFSDPIRRYVPSFQIDKFEVTQQAYAACVDRGKCRKPVCAWDPAKNPNQPVVCVVWEMADSYCRANGKRLPTTLEWEKAARGDKDKREYPWGNARPSCALSNGRDCKGSSAPVGTFSKDRSPYGVMDMGGNVSELTSERKRYPSGSFGMAKVMGGSWNSWGNDEYWVSYHSMEANRYYTGNGYDTLGFRCARDSE